MSSTKRQSRTANVKAQIEEIEDSRGRPTVRVTLTLGEISGTGDVPAGASTGQDEAQTKPVHEAIENIRKVLIPLVKESDTDLRRHDALIELERAIIDRAGENFADLGANAVLPVSRALWQLAAAIQDLTLCDYIRAKEPTLAGAGRVHLYMNIFNGGLHALDKEAGEQLGRDRIDIQEIMVVPVSASNYREAIKMGERIDAALKDVLHQRYSPEAVTRADEAGFSVKGLGDSETAISHVYEAIERAGFLPGDDVKLALDVAASTFYDVERGDYEIQGQRLSTDQMIAYICALVDRYPGRVLSVEDGLDENDWKGWERLSHALKERGVMTIGDDLFVTQVRRLRRGINNNSAHAILIKVNQNGSVTGTLDVMRYARESGLRCVISHRSGETLDDSIADLALATGAYGLKTGDPQPEEDFPDPTTWVRRVKYLRMIQLEERPRRH